MEVVTEMTALSEGVLEELTRPDCLRLLGQRGIGRVAVVVDDYPVVVPVNYRVVEIDEGVAVVVRTQPGSVIDQAPRVGFQVDGVDPVHRLGWSVLVRGTLDHLDDADVALLGEEIDPLPWVAEQSSWLVVRPTVITGRRLQPPAVEWAFSIRAYV